MCFARNKHYPFNGVISSNPSQNSLSKGTMTATDVYYGFGSGKYGCYVSFDLDCVKNQNKKRIAW